MAVGCSHVWGDQGTQPLGVCTSFSLCQHPKRKDQRPGPPKEGAGVTCGLTIPKELLRNGLPVISHSGFKSGLRDLRLGLLGAVKHWGQR